MSELVETVIVPTVIVPMGAVPDTFGIPSLSESESASEIAARMPVAESEEPVPNLTPRQREVLSWILTGLTGKDIARLMGISLKTLEAHRARIYTRAKARNMAHCVIRAIELGWVNRETLQVVR